VAENFRFVHGSIEDGTPVSTGGGTGAYSQVSQQYRMPAFLRV
jgi:hypothetical protein